MNANLRQYLFGLIFLGVGIYSIVTKNWLDTSLYTLAGLSFIFNQLVNEPRLAAYKKTLVIITWSFILITIILFLYWLQFRFL